MDRINRGDSKSLCMRAHGVRRLRYMLDIMIADMIVAMLMDLVMKAKVPW